MPEKTIEIPVHIINQVIKVYEKAETLSNEQNREPTDEELAESLDWPVKRVVAVKKVAAEIMAKAVPKNTESILDFFRSSLYTPFHLIFQ